MNRFHILFVVFLYGITACAQDADSFISIKSGVSSPVNDYSEKKLNVGSFTTAGIHVAMEGVWYIFPHWGVGTQVGLNLHPVDVGALGWEKVQADPFMEDLYIRSEAYQLINLSIGIYTQWSLFDRVSFNGKLAVGIMHAQTPWQYNKAQYYMIGERIYTITSSRDRSPFYQIAGGIQYRLNSCLALKIDGEFAFSNMTFGFTNSNGNYYQNKEISFINTNFGLVIIL